MAMVGYKFVYYSPIPQANLDHLDPKEYRFYWFKLAQSRTEHVLPGYDMVAVPRENGEQYEIQRELMNAASFIGCRSLLETVAHMIEGEMAMLVGFYFKTAGPEQTKGLIAKLMEPFVRKKKKQIPRRFRFRLLFEANASKERRAKAEEKKKNQVDAEAAENQGDAEKQQAKEAEKQQADTETAEKQAEAQEDYDSDEADHESDDDLDDDDADSDLEDDTEDPPELVAGLRDMQQDVARETARAKHERAEAWKREVKEVGDAAQDARREMAAYAQGLQKQKQDVETIQFSDECAFEIARWLSLVAVDQVFHHNTDMQATFLKLYSRKSFTRSAQNLYAHPLEKAVYFVFGMGMVRCWSAVSEGIVKFFERELRSHTLPPKLYNERTPCV